MTTTELKHGLAAGTPTIRAVGPLAFGPDGVLFVADNVSASIFAIDTRDETAVDAPVPLNIDALDTRLASYLGCNREDLLIKAMAVHPDSRNVYLSVMRGMGDRATPVIVRILRDGTFTTLSLESIPFSQVAIEDAPAADDQRTDWRRVQSNREGEITTRRDGLQTRVTHDPFRSITVTDLQYIPRKADWNVHGQLLVAGVSNEEFSSVLRRIAFPFHRAPQKVWVEVYHVNHGQYETVSPIRTFVLYANNTEIVASYTCTPLVSFSLEEMKAGTEVIGRTVGELGGWSTPVDMLVYHRGGEEFVLVANSGLPLMRIAARDIQKQDALTRPSSEPDGVARTPLHDGVEQMANLGEDYVLMLEVDGEGSYALRSYPTASL